MLVTVFGRIDPVDLTETALVAQWIEHGSPKAGVVGSIPIEGTHRPVQDPSRRLGALVPQEPIPVNTPAQNPRIVVSAVCVCNSAGHLLTVRKHGTSRFMNPGGKPDPGESAVEAATRELLEETGIVILPAQLQFLGTWVAAAANEAATEIVATVFTAPGTWTAEAAAEIAEIRWLDLNAPLPNDLAPLLTEHVLPALRQQHVTD